MKLSTLMPPILLAVAIAAIILWALFNRNQFDPAALDAWLASFGVLAPLVYVILYAIGTIAFVPSSHLWGGMTEVTACFSDPCS